VLTRQIAAARFDPGFDFARASARRCGMDRSVSPLGAGQMTMAGKPIQIDREKLRAEVRKLRSEYVFFMLDDAIELLSPAKLLKIAKKYFDLRRLRPDAEQVTNPSLLTGVKRFEKASLASEYYESFSVVETV